MWHRAAEDGGGAKGSGTAMGQLSTLGEGAIKDPFKNVMKTPALLSRKKMSPSTTLNTL